MKKTGIILLVVALILALTNPDKDDFKDFVTQNIQKELVKKGKNDQVSQIFKPLADGLAQLGGSLSSAFAHRENYYLFSIFTLGPENEPDAPRYLGIGTQFFRLN